MTERDNVFVHSDDDSDDTQPLLSQQLHAAEERDSKMEADKGVSYKAQYVTAACATLGALAVGAILGFASPAQAVLLTNSTSITLSSTESSWFSSSVNLGALVGGQAGGYCINYFGRRGTMMLLIVPFAIGWVLIISAQNFSMLLLGRIFTGLCCGMVSLSVPTYIGEFSSPKIRGLLGSCFQLMVTIGVVYAYALGAAFDGFRWLAGLCLVIPIFFSGSMFLNKESPVFLLAKGRENDASLALHHFRGKNYDITSEMTVLKDTLEKNQQNKITFKDLKAPYILKPLLISLGLMLFQQLSGINAVLFNLETIFDSAGSSMSSSLSSIIVGISQVVGTFIAAVLADRAGRRILLLVSSFSMVLSLVALGTYFYLSENGGAANLGWLPLVSLIIFIIGFAVGYGPVPWLMMSEIFSSDVREVAGGFATSFNWAWAFIITVTFTPLKEAINNSGVYWLFAGFNLISFFFVMFLVYETKGKTIEEITAHFGGKTDSNSKRVEVNRT